nr:CheY-like superfamily, signal transduction response regulator, PEP-CTERM system [Tanacetum cinerariifolium]
MSSSEKSPKKPLSIEDSFNPHGLKVLVVDNDPDSLLHLTEILTSCQYQATTCSLPSEALALIKEDNNKFDTVAMFSNDLLVHFEATKCFVYNKATSTNK